VERTCAPQTHSIFLIPALPLVYVLESRRRIQIRDVEAAISSTASASTPIASASNRAWTVSERGLYQSLDFIRAWTLSEPGLYQSLDFIRAWTLTEPGLSHLWTCWQAWLSKPAAYDLQRQITS